VDEVRRLQVRNRAGLRIDKSLAVVSRSSGLSPNIRVPFAGSEIKRIVTPSSRARTNGEEKRQSTQNAMDPKSPAFTNQIVGWALKRRRVTFSLVVAIVMRKMVPDGLGVQVRVKGLDGNFLWENLGWFKNHSIPQYRH
jgi:hypothetical protein